MWSGALGVAAVGVEARPGGPSRSGDRRRGCRRGAGQVAGACPEPVLLFSESFRRSCLLLSRRLRMGSPSGSCSACWPATGLVAWRRSSRAHERRKPTRGRPRLRSGTGLSSCGCGSPLMVWMPALRRSAGTWNRRGCGCYRLRRSAGSCTKPASSRPLRRSGHAPPTSASKRRSRTRCGSRTSSIGGLSTGLRSRSSTGLTTTPATCCPAPSTGPSPAMTWSAYS